MTLAEFIGAAALALIVLSALSLVARRRRRAFDRVLVRGPDGAIVGIGDHPRPEGRINGRGIADRPVDLLPGAYRLDYRFPVDMPTRVELVAAGDGIGETLLIAAGEGTIGFAVEVGGRYYFVIEPADGDSPWSLAWRQTVGPAQ